MALEEKVGHIVSVPVEGHYGFSQCSVCDVNLETKPTRTTPSQADPRKNDVYCSNCDARLIGIQPYIIPGGSD